MSRVEGGLFVVDPEDPATCETCGKVAELRPYGKGGKTICYECAMKDPKETERQIEKLMRGKTVVVTPEAEAVLREEE